MTMKSFNELNLHPILNKSLEIMKYDTPTPIQAKAIPFALDGRDIMGSAQTGTGKTAAFAIPLVQHLLDNEEACALVLTPTRELGKQIMDIMHQLLGKGGEINTAFLIGGDSMQKQLNQIKKRPRLVVGTPGRINDHLDRGTLKLQKTDFLVLDETDRMLDMGFSVQLDRIFAYLPEERQTLMFSATLPKDILRMSQAYLENPERIAVGSTINPAENIDQQVLRITDGEKGDVLLEELDKRMGSIIIFVKTKHGTERMAKRLQKLGHDAQAINGDMKQSRRARVIQMFRDMKFKILVATDVVARGLDIPHIEHVINYDLPQVPEDFIHRIGRTARAGAKGQALSLVTPTEERKWHAIELLMNPDMKPRFAPEKKGSRKGGGKRMGGGKSSPRSTRGGAAHFKGKPRSGGNKRKFDDKPEYGDKPAYAGKKKAFGDKPSYDEKKKPYGDKKKSFNNDNKPKQGNPNRNHKWDGTPKQEGDFSSHKPKREDRGYREEKDTNKKSPFKKSVGKKKMEGGDKPLSRKPHKKPFKKSEGPTSGKPSGKPGSKPKSKFGDKKTGSSFKQQRGTPKGAPQKGKKPYAGGKAKKNAAKRMAKQA